MNQYASGKTRADNKDKDKDREGRYIEMFCKIPTVVSEDDLQYIDNTSTIHRQVTIRQVSRRRGVLGTLPEYWTFF